MRPEIWEAQVKTARQNMHPDVAVLVEKINEPFASVVSSVITPQAAYFHDRLFLIGDALAQIQPNSGHGTNLAATAALWLSEVVAGKMSGDEFSEKMVAEAHDKNNVAIGLAARFMYSGQDGVASE